MPGQEIYYLSKRDNRTCSKPFDNIYDSEDKYSDPEFEPEGRKTLKQELLTI